MSRKALLLRNRRRIMGERAGVTGDGVRAGYQRRMIHNGRHDESIDRLQVL